MSAEKQTVDGGRGPKFEVEDFPEPLRQLTPRKLFAILGPAVIALGGTIGGGEWLIGPSLFVKWGLALLWVTTVSSILQVAGAEEGLAGVLRKAKIWQRINSQSPVNERQRTVINRLLDGFEGKLSTSKYAKLAKCSADTALRDIRILLDRGILIQDAGGGRNTSYRLVEPEDQPVKPDHD